MLSGLFQSAKSAYNTAAQSITTVQQFFYGATDGQLTTYEESFFRCAHELRKKNGGKLPAASVVLHAFMDKYVKRANRYTTDMSKESVAETCKQALINRGDEAIPAALAHVREVKEIDEVGYFAALLNVFFYLFPQHDPRDIDTLKNKEGKRKVLSPAKFQVNKWFEKFTNEKTFPHYVAGYQLEQVAEAMPNQYVDNFAACLLRMLPKEGAPPPFNLDTALEICSRFTALGIVYQRIKSRDLKKNIDKRLESEAAVSAADLNSNIIGAAQALRRSLEKPIESMAAPLMTYVSNHMDLILSLPERVQSTRDDKQKQEYQSFLRKVFLVLLQYERIFTPAQKQTVMFHLMQTKYCDTFRYEINMLRNWMSQDQLAQFRKEMLPKKNTNNETWFVCRPWLEDDYFLEPRGPVYYHRGKQAYDDVNLMKMLAPSQQELSILTYKMPFASRLKVLMRDFAGDESIEKVDGKFIPKAVVTSLLTVIPALCANLRTHERATFYRGYYNSEELRNLHLQYMQLMEAIPLLNSAQAFSKDQRLEFATQILNSQDHLETEEQHRPVYAALSICPDVLADAALKTKCETALLYYLHANALGEFEADIVNAFNIYAENIPFHELPPLMLAIGSHNENSTVALLALIQVNKVYEKRLPNAQMQARVDNSSNLQDNSKTSENRK